MPHEPTNADLLQQISDMRAELKENQRRTVPGQMTGTEDDGETRFWSFTDKLGNPIIAEDAQTGYGLATPLMNPVLYNTNPGTHFAGGWDFNAVQDGVTWERHWFGHVPNVNPYIAVSMYIKCVGAARINFRVVSNGNQVIYQAPPKGPMDAWFHTPPIKFQLANPGEVSFIGIDVMMLNPATEVCQYSFGGCYGRNSSS